MHYTLDAVDVAVEFTLEYGLEVCLHVLSGNFYHVCDRLFASYRELIKVRSDNFDLVIFDLAHIFSMNKLYTVNTGTIELNLHVATADDLTLECGCESNRDIDLGDLDLDVTCFQRCSIEFADVFLYDQALRYTEGLFVGNYREAKSDSAGTAGNDHFVQRSECVNESRYTVHGIFHQSCSISRCYVTEDQSCTKSYRYYMDNACYISTQRYDTNAVSQFHSLRQALIDTLTYHSYQDTLCLIGFNQLNSLFCCRSLTKDNSNTRDIACYQRYTQLTDDGICQMSVIRLCVRSCAINVFQNFDKLCAQSCSNTAHERIV